jgi:dienelactone hydrolase
VRSFSTRLRTKVAIGVAVLALAGCAGADGSHGGSTATTSALEPSDITEVPAPANGADTTFHWFAHPAANGAHVLLGVRRLETATPHGVVLLVHASGGLDADYLRFADALYARGFDVAVGCWFSTVHVGAAGDISIPCTDAPAFKGVVDDAVPDLDSLVEATYHALGASKRLMLVGFSRGAGIVALRAAGGALEPVALASGMYEGWNTIGSTVLGGEVNVVERVAAWRASTLILHGTADAAVPVSQAQHLEDALRGRGVDVEAEYYMGAGHNLAGDPNAPNVNERIAAFGCEHVRCAPAS